MKEARSFRLPPWLLLLCLLPIAAGLLTFSQPGQGASAAYDESQLISPDVVAGDQFGYAVAISGDTAVVGAYWTTVGGAEKAGAAYLFERSSADPAQWTQFRRLTASDGAAFDQFGAAVAIDGDTVLVGATGADVGGETNQGAAYLFQKDHGGADQWSEVAKLTDTGGGSFDNFGDSLAVQGDDLFVGAKDADVGSSRGRGTVFLFRPDQAIPGAWALADELVDPNGRENDSFGSALAVAGAWLVAGAERADVSGLYQNDGAALLFRKDAASGDWLFFKRLSASDAAGSDRFGASVALDGQRVLVGAPAASHNGEMLAGKAYLFERDLGGADNWGEIRLLAADDGSAFDHFGASVAIGAATAYVGASSGDITIGDEGAVYTFERDAGGADNWGQATKLAATDGQSGDLFGRTLALQEGTLLAGANNAAGGAGRAYAFTKAAPPESVSAFLPLVASPGFPTTGVLVDGGVVGNDDGVKLGAVAGSLDGDLPVSLLRHGAPLEPLPEAATRVGDFYLVAASRQVVQPLASSFILALPVPEGADSTRLAVALHSRVDGLLDQEQESGHYWNVIPGVYDPDAQLLLAQLPALSPLANVVALVEHPDMETPVTGSAAAAGPANGPAPKFAVLCAYHDCADSLKQEITQELTNNFFDFSSNHGYPAPRIQGTSSDMSLDPPHVGQPSATYYASILPDTHSACWDKQGNLVEGRYSPNNAELITCFAPSTTTLTDFHRETVRHEYFHALQYAYDNVRTDWANGDREQWIIEGMAEAAVNSGSAWARTDAFAIRPVDKGLRLTGGSLKYQAQDFWVFYGNNLVVGGLERLKPILERGATYEDVIAEVVFHDAYTLWVRNQAIEKNDDMDNALGAPCELEVDAVSNLLVWDLSVP
ncbi:MAG: FG-GAP repeat protein, partial [Candidatus Promineifilaceae bacterium]|nr:FG-GAP repeat protein [Candidatus Promineifilaceae bacterium]